MPKHPFSPLQGRVERFRIESECLAGNLLGDPANRETFVYLPPEYDQTDLIYPLFVYLGPYTGSAPKKLAWRAFEENIPQRLERLLQRQEMGPVVMAFPDSFTSLGGNQFVNSPVLGNWEDYLCREWIPEVERRYRVPTAAPGRALLGFSSGGYGALVQALSRADYWGAIAAHSPDIGFDLTFRSDLATLLTRLSHFDGSIEGFLRDFWDSRRISGSDWRCLMLLGLAASYDPAEAEPMGIRLPVDLETCEPIPERWENWLAKDPLSLLEQPSSQANLKKLRGLFLDCGTYDQYHLQYGLRRFARRLRELEIEHRHDEFPDSHSGVEYRLDESLPYLYSRLT